MVISAPYKMVQNYFKQVVMFWTRFDSATVYMWNILLKHLAILMLIPASSQYHHLIVHYKNQKLYLLILFNGLELTWTNKKQMYFLLTNINKD